jgi:hypothetical protein
MPTVQDAQTIYQRLINWLYSSRKAFLEFFHPTAASQGITRPTLSRMETNGIHLIGNFVVHKFLSLRARCMSFHYFPTAVLRQTNETLPNIYQHLLQAGVDRTESERKAKLMETLSSLQRVFPSERYFLSSNQFNSIHPAGQSSSSVPPNSVFQSAASQR